MKIEIDEKATPFQVASEIINLAETQHAGKRYSYDELELIARHITNYVDAERPYAEDAEEDAW